MDPIDSTMSLSGQHGGDTPSEALPAPVSPPEPTPPENGEEPAPPTPEGVETIDAIVRGPVLNAKVGATISVTPEVYRSNERFLRRIH